MTARAAQPGPRRRARELAVQALYQLQVAGHDAAELLEQFHDRAEYGRVDQAYFDEVLKAICAERATIEQRIAALADRPVSQLDPVETAVLLLGVHELESRSEIPYRVVINEAVDLAKRFGSADGHKYVNAVLDRAAAELRSSETG